MVDHGNRTVEQYHQGRGRRRFSLRLGPRSPRPSRPGSCRRPSRGRALRRLGAAACRPARPRRAPATPKLAVVRISRPPTTRRAEVAKNSWSRCAHRARAFERRLRKEYGKLLAAEPRRNIDVAHVLAQEHPRTTGGAPVSRSDGRSRSFTRLKSSRSERMIEGGTVRLVRPISLPSRGHEPPPVDEPGRARR